MAMKKFLAQGWQSSSPLARAGIIAGTVFALALLIGGTVGLVHYFQDAAYQKREEQREAERQQLEAEKDQLRLEKKKQETIAEEAIAQRDAFKQVAESKRTDKAKTIKELEQIEAQHQQHKAEIEATGGSLNDTELRRELCERLRARGYPPCPD